MKRNVLASVRNTLTMANPVGFAKGVVSTFTDTQYPTFGEIFYSPTMAVGIVLATLGLALLGVAQNKGGKEYKEDRKSKHIYKASLAFCIIGGFAMLVMFIRKFIVKSVKFKMPELNMSSWVGHGYKPIK